MVIRTFAASAQHSMADQTQAYRPLRTVTGENMQDLSGVMGVCVTLLEFEKYRIILLMSTLSRHVSSLYEVVSTGIF